MTSRFRIRPLDVMVVAGVAYCIFVMRGSSGAHQQPETKDFASHVDLSPLERTAVHADGRLRSFESHAKTFMSFVTGPRRIEGHTNGFTYLDMMLRPSTYTNEPIIYVKNKNVRAELVKARQRAGRADAEWAARFMKRGLIAKSALAEPALAELMQRLGQDLIRTSKAVDAIQSALTVSSPEFLAHQLRLVPSPDGDDKKQWWALDELQRAGRQGALAELSAENRRTLETAWSGLRSAWIQRDAEAVNRHLTTLANVLPAIAPDIYPSQGRLEWETWYFRQNGMTWVWLLYLLSVVPLLMSVIYKWDRARTIGLVMFCVAFAAQTVSLGLRWYVSGRWPNANMFEAVTTSAWFGGLGALVLEYVVRKSPFRNLFALASAVVSMVALMIAYFLPAHLDSSISNKMAALNDIWLYIHTNVIIWSYAVIALACIPALLLLRDRWNEAWDSRSIPAARLLLLPIAAVVAGWTVYLLVMHVVDPVNWGLSESGRYGVIGACWGAFMILILEGMHARARRLAGGSELERSASGGASSLILGAGSRGSKGFLSPEKPTPSQVYDGAMMVLVELAFIMLWTGTVMGAIWADHSWGRPWGWDPKEVLALNTFLIFLILIHVRFKVRDKGFWTAILAIVGCAVMLFNWIVVNFIITGLHSYA